jgi:hypothetical protein
MRTTNDCSIEPSIPCAQRDETPLKDVDMTQPPV